MGRGGVRLPAPHPAEGRVVTSSEGAPTRCPRCQTLVAGDYKFCPACAYRLRVDLGAEPVPVAPRSPWKTGFLVATGAAVVLGCALLGVLLFAPSLFEGAGPRPSAPPNLWGDAPLAYTPIRVVDLPSEMVELDTGGFAYTSSFASVPNDPSLAPDDPALADKDQPRAKWRKAIEAALPDGDSIEALSPWAFRAMRYEVTCGQYAEFLDDVQTHRERVPDYWRANDGVPSREDVDLYKHVPSTWILRDAAGEPAGWRLEDADRNLPVTRVSVVDAQGFAEWAGATLGLRLRLPLVMEWSRAARGGKRENVWPWGKDRYVYACNNLGIWPGTGAPRFVHFPYAEPPDGGQGATKEGLFAMAGNVAEWALGEDFEVRWPLESGPPYLVWKAKTAGLLYYACGGSFRSGIDDCRAESWERVPGLTAFRDDIGFRLVADPKGP